MGRRSRNDSIPEMLMEILEFIFQHVPPWTSIPVAIVGFFLIVSVWVSTIKIAPLQTFGVLLGIGFAVLCLIAGAKGAQFQRNQRAFLKSDIDTEWVRGLSWRGFEQQLAEVYRQKGYQVEETGGGGADGGIDLKLFKDGLTTIVQCKHWRTWKVNVKPIRELFGVMTAEGADSAMFITSGRYTSDARIFAEGKPIELIDRDGFLDLIRHFQKELQVHYGMEPNDQRTPVATHASPNCPLCQGPMVLRTARRGKNAGSQFWGCSRYPDCRGTKDYVD